MYLGLQCYIFGLICTINLIDLDFNKPDCIVFDLGGVIVDLDSMKTFNELVSYARKELKLEEIAEHPLLHDFERGQIEASDFVRDLSQVIDAAVEHDQLIKSWNAMIIDVPPARLELVRKLGEQIPVYAFSNTNSLHIEFLDDMLRDRYGYDSVASYFDRAFYSYQMGHRKPDPESFDWIVKEMGAAEKNVLFLDDNLINIQAAERAGFKGWHITSPHQWIDYFSEWKN